MTRPGVSAAAFGALDMMEELRDRSADAQLPIASIRVLPEFNPRRLLGDQAFTNEALADLAQNIRTYGCLLYTSPSPRDLSTSRMPSSA